MHHPAQKAEARSRRSLLVSAASAVLVLACALQAEAQGVLPQSPAQHCEALAEPTQAWPDSTLRILSAKVRAAGSTVDLGFGGMKSAPLPAHCEILGIMHERTGLDGDRYAIRFHLRLPKNWNGRFLFEGGGGTDGNLGTALGMIGFRNPPALMQGDTIRRRIVSRQRPVLKRRGRAASGPCVRIQRSRDTTARAISRRPKASCALLRIRRSSRIGGNAPTAHASRSASVVGGHGLEGRMGCQTRM